MAAVNLAGRDQEGPLHAVIKANQPTAYRQLAALPWRDISVQHTTTSTGHGRRESRSVKTCGIVDELGGIAFPHADLALRIHRRRRQKIDAGNVQHVHACATLAAGFTCAPA
ncbi:hypothetical protein ABZ397_31055 [Streptomyces sp. NPDC005876]|uniref:hypothetical protein n=1 Tax=Streptomyces sp. NPDC005876 TaxID=3157076 RepID=UPI0034067904